MSAVFSEDGVYRYALARELPRPLGEEERTLLFVLLNPSTADAERTDPTVRRCIGFARRWNYSRLMICNLFALRSTSPKLLYEAEDPVGPENDAWLRRCASEADLIVAGWGAHGILHDRGGEVVALLAEYPVYALGMTVDGQPRHPLYLTGNADPFVWWDDR